MFAEDLPRICIFEDKELYDKVVSAKKQEYVYFTYLDKLVEVKRDKSGKYQSFKKADKNKLDHVSLKNMKPFLNRAFLMGQKYLSIKIPFSNIVLAKQENINTKRR